MSRSLIYVLGAALIVAGLALMAWRSQRVLSANLPPRVECASQAEARDLAGLHGVAILGTGSMAPYIPPAPAGRDPLRTVCAFAVLDASASFDSITPGALCIYAPGWANGGLVIHVAAEKDRAGWIMSGLNNAHSEAAWRVTPANFRGIVRRVYTWPL